MERGFTLLEMMAAIAILTIVVGIGLPSFTYIVENNRIQAAADTFFSALVIARSEAVKRNQQVVLCKSANATSCTTSGNWEQGWLIFADTDGDTVLDSGESIVQTNNALPGVTLRAVNGSDDLFAYLPDATLTAAEIFDICIDSDTDSGRSIDIGITGRPSRDKGATQCP